MKKSQHSKSFWSGKGFYAALTLVIAGAAAASFLAINSMMAKLGTSPVPEDLGEETTPWQEQQNTPAEEKQPGVPVTPKTESEKPESETPRVTEPEETQSSSATPKASSKKPSASSSSSSPQTPASESAAPAVRPAESAAQPAAPEPQYVSPKSGAVLQAFSGDELVYNETMRDWRTHNGMDIAGKDGDKVKSPAAGTVTRAEKDPLWGGVVEIEAGDVTVRVCGLTSLSVKQGQTVSRGDALGSLGELPAESALPAHIHVEFVQSGALADPAAFFTQS